MKEILLQLVTELKVHLQNVPMTEEQRHYSSGRLAEIEKVLTAIDGASEEVTSGFENDLTEPVYPHPGTYKVLLNGDWPHLIERDGGWFIDKTPIQVTDEDLKKQYMHISVSNDFHTWPKGVHSDDYRMYGYKFSDNQKAPPEDSYLWYDKQEKRFVPKGKIRNYQNDHLK